MRAWAAALGYKVDEIENQVDCIYVETDNREDIAILRDAIAGLCHVLTDLLAHTGEDA